MLRFAYEVSIFLNCSVFGSIHIQYLASTQMKNEEFELKLLVKQNTQLSVKLQTYRRQNIQLGKKNQNLNSWVQNLSQVFASISSTWKYITENEEVLYTLMRKKNDPLSKQMINKYINHFKTYDEIVSNLGQKIMNEGHSDQATFDIKARLTLFVSNYQLFFMELVDSFFKFNQETIAFAAQKLRDQKLQPNVKQIMMRDLQNKQKIKELQEVIAKINQNAKNYELYNQHLLLDGIVKAKETQIQDLKDKIQKLKRRLAFMTDYNADNINFVLEQNNLECFCGGAPLKYYRKILEEGSLRQQSLQKKLSEVMIDEGTENNKEVSAKIEELEKQKYYLLQRNTYLSNKIEKSKGQAKITDDKILQSPVYGHLRNQFKELMDYTNDLLIRLNKNYEYLNQIQRLRHEQIEQLKKKYEKNTLITAKSNHESRYEMDNQIMAKFKSFLQGNFNEIKLIHSQVNTYLNDKENSIKQTKETLKAIKKDNEQLHKKLNELQQKYSKNIEHMQFRYPKFTELQEKIALILKNQPISEELISIKKTWEEFMQYAKNRDKKIKALEDQIKKKDKEILSKVKFDQMVKNMLNETQNLYTEKTNKFSIFPQLIVKLEKEIASLSEELYKFKFQADQQKNMLNLRLKNEVDIRNRLEQRVKLIDRLENEIKFVKNSEITYETQYQSHCQDKKNIVDRLKISLKEKQRQLQNYIANLGEKQRNLQKLITDKQNLNLQINRLQHKMSNAEQEDEYSNLKRQLQTYKSKIMCYCAKNHEKQLSLRTCPHMFCKPCIDNAQKYRIRRCPICSVPFDKNDKKTIIWA